MAGAWVLDGAPRTAAGLATQRTYVVAMRLRFGLKIHPALPLPPESRCAHVSRESGRCKGSLDEYGHHSVACGTGGGFVARHNGAVRALAAELRSLGLRVRTEVWVDDLTEHFQGGMRAARMDLVVESARGTDYLDVTCFHPFTRKGKRRTHATGGSPEAQEGRKRGRYPAREPGSRRRLTLARFVPVAVATYGVVGPAASALFFEYEIAAREEFPERFARRQGGWLAAQVTEAAVLGSVRMAIAAYMPPDGQERAYLRGEAAT
jgi:hypothetical protein